MKLPVTSDEFEDIKAFFDKFNDATIIEAAEWFERSPSVICIVKNTSTYPLYRRKVKANNRKYNNKERREEKNAQNLRQEILDHVQRLNKAVMKYFDSKS